MIQKPSLSKMENQNNSHNFPKSIHFHYWVIKIWTSFPLLSCQNIHLFVHPSNGFWYDSELPHPSHLKTGLLSQFDSKSYPLREGPTHIWGQHWQIGIHHTLSIAPSLFNTVQSVLYFEVDNICNCYSEILLILSRGYV